jgi:hypothetical protein
LLRAVVFAADFEDSKLRVAALDGFAVARVCVLELVGFDERLP